MLLSSYVSNHPKESGHDLNVAELSEVLVKGERLSDAEAFDDGFARAVCEAPVFVVKALEDFPREGDVRLVERVDFGEPRVEESFAEHESARSFAPRAKQRQRLVNDVICRQERFGVVRKPTRGGGVIRV